MVAFSMSLAFGRTAAPSRRLVQLVQIALLLTHFGLAACQSAAICAGGVSTENGVGCAACDPGLADCNQNSADGCEARLTSDPKNCGQCGTICPLQSTNQALCRQGVCGGCPKGSLDCNGRGEDGCETQSSSDVMNCGACGRVCPAIPKGTPACIDGRCVLSSCSAGFADCNADLKDGCEVNTQNDPANCGTCGGRCQNTATAEVECNAGTCKLVRCAAGFGNCTVPSGPLLSCATDLKSDVDHCSSCGLKCPLVPNDQRICKAGVCDTKPCDANHKDCNNNPADGCETNVSKDANNCGSCNTRCSTSLPNVASATCALGSCVIDACLGDFADCNGIPADGCETNLATSAASCGSCGLACKVDANLRVASAKCVQKVCAVATCTPGFGDCDGLYSNGCEANLDTNTDHCGSCPNACDPPPNMTVACVLGRCVRNCVANFRNCDNREDNGCEVDSLTDADHCGTCNNRCAVCAGGVCK